MKNTHAILSPSAAHRWLNCTPSARFEEQFPDSASEVAREGTLAHSLGELLIRFKTNLVQKTAYEKHLLKIQADDLYDTSMLEHADYYATFVLETLAEAQSHTKDALLFLEQKLNLTDYVPEGYGTGDTIIIADSILDIIDLKYGKGVSVSAEQNKQMMLYSLGALREFDYLYDIHTVRMTIFQPRLDSISTWEISVNELRSWAEDELKPRALLAFDGKGEFAPGKHCQFCRAKAVCKANAEMNLELARYDFLEAVKLGDHDISDILQRADIFKNWLSSVEEYALTEAVNNGKKWPGYKLVEGRSNRQYTDETKVAIKLTKEGYKEEEIYNKKLLGITAMEKLMGKAVFNTKLSDLIIKPEGKPTLVEESDKRPEYHSAQSAAKDFANS